jgi:hypothetical protein
VSLLLPPSSSESERLSSPRASIAASERNGSHSISEATRSLTSPMSPSRSHKAIAFDATTVGRDPPALALTGCLVRISELWIRSGHLKLRAFAAE